MSGYLRKPEFTHWDNVYCSPCKSRLAEKWDLSRNRGFDNGVIGCCICFLFVSSLVRICHLICPFLSDMPTCAHERKKQSSESKVDVIFILDIQLTHMDTWSMDSMDTCLDIRFYGYMTRIVFTTTIHINISSRQEISGYSNNWHSLHLCTTLWRHRLHF